MILCRSYLHNWKCHCWGFLTHTFLKNDTTFDRMGCALVQAVPNLGYAYPQGYVKNLKGYASLRCKLRLSIKNVIKCLKGYSSFLFFCLGVRNHKKVGNRCSSLSLTLSKLCGNSQKFLRQIRKIFITFRSFYGAIIHRKQVI